MKRMAMMTPKLTILAFGLLLAAPVHGQNGQRFALLPRREARAISHLCSRNGPKVDGSWKPTKGDIESLESDLPRISESKVEEGIVGVRIVNPSSYYRQYLGILVAGRKLIYLNAFTHETKDWRDRLVIVCDGGTGAWGVLYDPEKHEFSKLATNGGF